MDVLEGALESQNSPLLTVADGPLLMIDVRPSQTVAD